MIWILAFGTPLAVLGLLVGCTLLRGAARRAVQRTISAWAWVAVIPAGIAALTAGGAEYRVDWLLLGTAVQLDDVGGPLLGLAAAVYGLGLAFVPRAKTKRPHILTGFLLLCFLGNIGVFVAADLVTFYLSFTVVSFAGYAAVIHTGTAPSRRAGNIYLVLTVIGESAVLAAMLLIAGSGTLAVRDAPAAVADSPVSSLIILLLIVGFGVKAGTVPLHVWLPLAHPAAPTPASAVLSGVMLKAGLIGFLRFLPLGEGAGEPGWGAAIVLLALLGGFLAIPVGLLQDDPKVILAYSSISQLGFILALVGVALTEPGLAGACVAAAVVYAVHHGLVKGVLFLGVQAWDSERMPRRLVAAAMGVAGLSLAGAPLTSGFVAKYVAKQAVEDAVVPFTSLELYDVLPWVGVGSTVLLARLALVMRRRSRHPARTPLSRDAAWVLLAVGAVIPVWLVARDREQVLSLPGFAALGPILDQSWPVLLGIALAAAAMMISSRPRFAESPIAHPHGETIPPGDLIAVEERAVRASAAAIRWAFARGSDAASHLRSRIAALPRPVVLIDETQRVVGTWAGSGALLLAVTAAALIWATAGGAR